MSDVWYFGECDNADTRAFFMAMGELADGEPWSDLSAKQQRAVLARAQQIKTELQRRSDADEQP